MNIHKLLTSIVSVFLISSALSAQSIDWIHIHNEVYENPETDFSILSSEPDKEEYYRGAVYLLTIREEASSEDYFRKVLSIDENAPEPLWGLAELKRRRYLVEESAQILDRIIEEHPYFAPAKASRAYLYFEEENYSAAISLAYELIDNRENTDKANFIRAHLIMGGASAMIALESFILGRIARGLSARRYLRDAKELDSDFPEVLLAWGSYYLEAPRIAGGSLEKAEEFLMRAKEKSPNFSDIHARIAQLYLKKGDRNKYSEYIRRALELDPKNRVAEEVRREYESYYE